MIYTLKEYADNIAHCHFNTLKTRIKKKQLPSNHIVKKGKQYMIEIIHGSENCRACDNSHHAAIEFHRRKRSNTDMELAAEISIKYDINTNKFFKMMGVL